MTTSCTGDNTLFVKGLLTPVMTLPTPLFHHSHTHITHIHPQTLYTPSLYSLAGVIPIGPSARHTSTHKNTHTHTHISSHTGHRPLEESLWVRLNGLPDHLPSLCVCSVYTEADNSAIKSPIFLSFTQIRICLSCSERMVGDKQNTCRWVFCSLTGLVSGPQQCTGLKKQLALGAPNENTPQKHR